MKHFQVKHWLKVGDLVETITELRVKDKIVVPATYVKAGRLGVVLDVYVAYNEDSYDYPAVKVNLADSNLVIRSPEKYFKLVQRPEGSP